MSRVRVPALALALAALLAAAALVAGCGGSGGSGLSDALSYVPKDSPFVVTVKTDGSDSQYKQVKSLLGRFPGGQQLGQSLSARVGGSGVDFNRDIKPVLGNDAVLAAATPAALQAGHLLAALKAKDEAKAKQLVARGATRVGSSHGADVYQEQRGQGVVAVKDGVIVDAPTRSDLDQALARAGGSEHMTTSDLDARLTGVPTDALVRVGVDLQALINQSASGGTARRVPWVNALQTFGAAVVAQSDGLAITFNVRTQPTGLGPGDLPFASGASSPPVVQRPGEIGVGVRGVDQTIRFAENAAQAVNPGSLGRLDRSFAQIGTRYGVDVRRDVIGQLSGNTSLSFALGGGFAMRTELADPTAFRTTLRKLSPGLTRFAAGAGLRNASLVQPGHGNPFYALAGSNGKRYVFGVVGNVFVLATDSARAAQFAAHAPAPVPGASGAFATSTDAKSLVAAILNQRHVGSAALLFVQPLGNLTGSVEASTSGLTGHLKLSIR